MSTEKLPEGWVKTNLENIASWGSGGTPSRSHDEFYNGNIPWIKTGDLGPKLITKTSEYITDDGVKNSSAKYFPKGSIAIAMYGATIGKTSILGIEATTNQACAVGIPLEGLTSSFFLYYFLLNEKNAFIKKGKGGAQPNISQGVIKEHSICLPPLAEQKVITDKLDTLLAQVDSTKARLEQIPQILKRFRQAVLTAAISGKLTEDYRENQVITSWENTTLGTLIIDSCNGLAKRSGTDGEDITILRLADFKNAQRIRGNERKITLDSKEINKYSLKKSDILVIRVNGSADLAGRFIEYKQNDDIEGFCDHFIRLRLNSEKISSRFLTFIANEGEGRFYLRNSLSTSAGQNTINQTSIKGLALSLPTLPEQQEIVRRVEQLFAYADTIEKQVNNALARVNNLTQSILAKAFRGELTSQWRAENPDLISGENSAAALLEKIKAERAASSSKKVSRKKK
ncbi:restriction endonuclease subunit S [Proteus faecis]|uniref:Restriction endonuclease subunit S n=1 Tax=Proteus faecis TaxID=2050967 RepID=A0ABZ3EIQ9_9GAMM|nr:restriction endonuclease subunit S [Proteus faecis]MDM3867624.1 restriction endonuclease subunit S [Proteus faecis]